MCRYTSSFRQRNYLKCTYNFLVERFQPVFTARRNARIASAVLAIPWTSVRLSVTRWYCVKTTIRSTVQFALSDSKMSSFVKKNKKIFPRDDPFPLKSWLKLTHPLLKAASFYTFCLVARSASTVRAGEKSSIMTNRKSYTGFPINEL